jgi:rhodanese-related sulfurtransferase
MKSKAQRIIGILLLLFVIGFGALTPLVHTLWNSVPSVTPDEVRAALAKDPQKNLLVDIRQDNVYGAALLPGTLKEASPQTMNPELLRSKERVFLLCNTGWESSRAVRQLRKIGMNNVFSVQGGLERWLSGNSAACKTADRAVKEVPDEAVKRIPFTRLEQVMICVASFGLKPLYELLALVLAWVIWKKPESHWRVIRWGLLAFFLGENACAVNYLFYGLENFTWEFWHCYGMLVAFGLISYALVDFVDHQLLHYSQRETPCAFVNICKKCYKHQPVACNLWILFLFTIPAFIILCLMPLCAPFINFMSVGPVLGPDVLFTHSVLQQLYEIRIYPLLAIFFFVTAWLILVKEKEEGMASSKILFAAGLATMGFSLMRFLIYWSFSDTLLWAEVWEEITEFLFIISIVVLLCVKTISHRLIAR